MKRYWTTVRDSSTAWLDIGDGVVSFGRRSGSAFTEIGAECSFDEFLSGRWNETILNDHDADILAEAQSTVSAIMKGKD